MQTYRFKVDGFLFGKGILEVKAETPRSAWDKACDFVIKTRRKGVPELALKGIA